MENLDKEYDFLFDLPPELTDLILSFLSHSKWRFKMRRICNKWKNWINITDFKLGLIFGHELREIAEWFSKSKSSFGLNFSKATIHTIRTDQYAPLKILTNLTSLTVAHKQVSDGKDPEWLSALTNLEQLDLHMITKATLTPLKKLKKLNVGVYTIKDYYSDEKTDEEEILLDLPFLESASFHPISATDLTPLIKDGARLTHLSLLGFQKLQPNYWDQFINLKTLEIIAKTVLIYENTFTYYMYINLDRPLPNLESLTTNTDVTFFDTMLNLTYLRIDRTYGKIQNATNYANIGQLTNLRVLKLQGIKEDFALDLSGLKYLSSLALARQYRSTAKLEKILNSVSPDKLKKLMYSEDHNQDYTRIISKFSNLTDLDITIDSDQKTEKDLSPVMILTNLAILVINGGHTKWTLSGLSKLGNALRKLFIKGADTDKSEGVEELKELTNLTDLEISLGCNDIDISGITTLESITLNALNFIYNKEDLKYLTQLTISKPLEKWSDLQCMTTLESFTFSMPLEDLEPAKAILELSQLKNLRFVFLPQTPWHDHLTRLSQLHSFRVYGTIPYNNENIREKIPLYTEFTNPTNPSYVTYA